MMKKLLFVIVLFLPLATGNVVVQSGGNVNPVDLIIPVDQITLADRTIHADPPITYPLVITLPIFSIAPIEPISSDFYDSWNMLFNNSSINNLNLSSNNRSMSTT